MKLGVLGGTFDPVHMGHLILAEEACYQFALTRVLWVLTPDPPHKTGKTVLGWQDRWRMLNLALAGNDAFELCDVDTRRAPPYYAVDTMGILKKKYPSDQLLYLIGGDSLRDLPSWHNPEELIAVCDGLGVMMRAEVPIDTQRLEMSIPGIQKKLLLVSARPVDISSTSIRSRIANGQPYRYLLHSAVYEYIRDNQLYLAK